MLNKTIENNIRNLFSEKKYDELIERIEKISNFYQTSGLKTIKSVVFSYGKCDDGGGVQALRWKLVTTRIFFINYFIRSLIPLTRLIIIS